MDITIPEYCLNGLQTIADRLGLYVQAYTLYSSVRPFGISTILGAVDKDGPSLYVVEPSGVFFVCLTSSLDSTPLLMCDINRVTTALLLVKAGNSPRQSWRS
jgi:hypothetical protein